MDYNKKRVKWYWWALLTIYCVGVIYWVLKSNPYLYSNIEFQKALVGRKSNTPQTFVAGPAVAADSQARPEAISLWLYSERRTGVDPSEVTRNRKFIESSSTVLEIPENFEPQTWVSDSLGLLLIAKNGQIAAYDWEGALTWKFTPPEAVVFFRPLLLSQQVILSSRNGEVYSIGRQDGRLQWHIPIGQEIYSSPIPNETSFFVALKPHTREIKPASTKAKAKPQSKEAEEDDLSPGLAQIELRTGEWQKVSKSLPFDQDVGWSKAGKDTLYLTHERTLYQIEISTLELKRSKEFEAEIISPVTVLTNDLIVTTKDGRIFGLKASNLEQNYESDLGQSATTPPIYIPLHDRLAVITDNGYLHVATANKGERKWRFNLQNESPSSIGWTSRLNGKHIEQLNLGWVYKGWSLWVPCVKDRVCIYNPAEGQIIDRIILSGAYMGPPYIQEKSFYFLLKKDDQWKIAHYIERPLSGTSQETAN